MKFLRATIVQSNAADLVMIETDLASPMPKVTDQSLFIKFDVEYDMGEKYVLNNFPEIKDIEIIKRF